VASFPPAAPRRAVERVRRAVALVERRGKVLVVRQDGPLLDGLWEPPGVDASGLKRPARRLRVLLATLGIAAPRLRRTGQVIRHAITHRRIEAEVWRAEGIEVGPPRAARPPRTRWVDPERPVVALTALGRTLTRRLRGGTAPVLPAAEPPRRRTSRRSRATAPPRSPT
jgi:hypothetical protein